MTLNDDLSMTLRRHCASKSLYIVKKIGQYNYTDIISSKTEALITLK